MTPPHNQAGALAMLDQPRAVPFNADARAYEAFGFGESTTRLLDALEATSLDDALGETTSRWSWDRGDRLGIREIGDKVDRLHVYAVRRKSAPNFTYRDYAQHREFARWLDHVCTIDLHTIAGINLPAVGCERDIHARRQAQRPEGARR